MLLLHVFTGSWIKLKIINNENGIFTWNCSPVDRVQFHLERRVCNHGNNQFLSERGFDLCLSDER